MSEERVPIVGEAVVFHDEHAVPHDALITVVHGASCVNLLYVSQDVAKQDQYGRQIERRSSCSRGSVVQAHGNYWRYQADQANALSAPLSR